MNRLGINWFDLVFIAVIALGVAVGRKRGMSSELLDLIQWVVIIALGGVVYLPLGGQLANLTGMSSVTTCIAVYLLVAIAVKGLFVLIKRGAGEKLLGSDVFGLFEYYLGMIAGGLRFFCILLFLLAIFNAPQVSDQELARRIKAQNESLGAIYFPPLGTIQRAVFKNSFFGKLINEHLHTQLIEIAPMNASGDGRDTIWRQRQREVDEIIKPRR